MRPRSIMALALAAATSACIVERVIVRAPPPVAPPPDPVATEPPSPTPPPVPQPPDKDVILALDGVVVEVRVPRVPVRGHILVLPGWSFDRREVCWSSTFCEEALQRGYVVVLAGMDKSIYAGAIYPETRFDMAHYKTRTWVTERLLPELQTRLHVLLPGGDNFLYGMSTGGRGVALLALHTQGIFRAGAALSGDFDMLEEKNDPLLVLHYGPYKKFPERWSGDDNPALQVERITLPLYLGTGTSDRTVPMTQSVRFHARLRAAHPDLDVRLHMVDGAGHNFAFWGGETASVLAFFDEHRALAGITFGDPR